MQKHKRPISQNPSPNLVKYSQKIEINRDKPIIDVACGYGRNGAYFVDQGYKCIFCDNDDDAINFIKEGTNVSRTGNFNKDLATILKIDLINDKWIFPEKSCNGIINVHFYRKELIPLFAQTIDIGGFLYFETISARGMNYLELPVYKEVYNLLSQKFNFIYYNEKEVKSENLHKATSCIFAVRVK